MGEDAKLGLGSCAVMPTEGERSKINAVIYVQGKGLGVGGIPVYAREGVTHKVIH